MAPENQYIMKAIKLLLILMIFCGCTTKSKDVHTISIINNSTSRFDSIIVSGGGTFIKFYNVKGGMQSTKEYKVIKTFLGDDAFGGRYYSSDTSFSYSSFGYNSSPEDVPHKVILTIDRDLRVRDSTVK